MKKTIVLISVFALIFALSACKATPSEKNWGSADKEQRTFETTAVKELSALSVVDGEEQGSVELPSAQSKNEGQNEQYISRQQAIDTALQAAGLKADAVYDLSAELDREPYGTFWEVEFETFEKEYSYDMDAVTGTVVHQETERND